MALPLISVGVPAWRGAEFIAETLESILRQRDVRLRVFVSVDGADEASARACRPFAGDPRLRLAVQPERLGWVRNSAVVLAEAAEASADYACIQPQDDLLAEDYLAALLAWAEASPGAALVYSDIAMFGGRSGELRQPAGVGSPLARQVALLLEHYNAVGYRGLTRVSALARLPPITGNPHDDFAADTVWMARLARAGVLLRVPRPLYRKRYHAANTHAGWTAWPIDRKVAAWTRHCLDMLAEALIVAEDPASRRLLEAAARVRLLRLARPLGPYHADLTALPADAQARMLADFDAGVAGR